MLLKKFSVNIKEAFRELKTIRDFVRFGVSQFQKAKIYFGHGTDNAWDEAVYLILHALHLPPDTDRAVFDARLTTSEKKTALELIKKRVEKRIPAAYLTHEAWFAGRPYFVDERVLIPRSPIAELIEKQFTPWIESEKVWRILDIGTGSGCIAIACAHAFPESLVDAVDNSAAAIKVAELNVENHGVGDRVNLIKSDLFASVPNQKYDIIVSNPPYVSAKEMKILPDEYGHEPRSALVADQDGAAIIARILKDAAKHLTKHGILVIETGNTEEVVAKRFPHLPFLWLEFERGGGGVFLLTAEQLRKNILSA